MKRVLAFLFAAASCSAIALAQAAEFKGKVTKPDGVTPLANVRTALYKHNTQTGYYDYFTVVFTDATGNYSLTTQQKGVYLVYLNQPSASGFYGAGFQYPFQSSSYYYYDDPLAIYYPETYNDVTPLTPTKAPTQFVVTDLAKVTTLALVKLNAITNDCLVTGPITINGVPYSYFSLYGGGPSLPATGGTLNISFKVNNSTSAAISTNLQALAFLTRRDASYANGDHSVQAFARKAQSLPAKTTTTVNLAVSVPAALMAASPPNDYYGNLAFNLGVQMVTAQGVANCEDVMFPVLNVPTPASAQLQELPDPATQRQEEPDMIPLRLSKTGQVIEWGPTPSTK